MSGSLARAMAQTLGGGAAVAGVSFLRNVLIARVMGAAAFGLWNVCLVAQKIATESHLGALSAVAVDSPIERGADHGAAADRIERDGATLTLLLGVVAGAVSALVLRWIGGPALDTAALLLAVSVVMQQEFFAAATILRARRRFGGLPVGQGLFAAIYIVGLLWLLPTYYVSGVLAAGSVALAVALVAVYRHTPQAVPFPRLPSPARAFALIRRGLPIYMVQLTLVLLLQADRVVVGAALGSEALGHYGVLVIGGSALLFVPDAFSSVLWPFASESYGRHRRDAAVLGPLSVAAVTNLSLLLLGGLPFTLVATDALVAHVLPQYAGALPAVRPYLAGLFPLAIALPLRNVLVTVGASGRLLRLQTVLLVLLVVLQISAAVNGLGIVGVAWTGAIVWTLLLAAFLSILRSTGVLTGREVATAALHTVLACAAALAVDAALDIGTPAIDTLAGLGARAGVTGCLALAMAVLVVQRTRGRPT